MKPVSIEEVTMPGHAESSGQISESNLEHPPRLYTPAQAAEILTIKESWLRRQAGQRKIPCTILGKHLRFSDADLNAIARNGRRPPRAPRRLSRAT
jgi:excisionase family DNA binding protein